MKVVNVFTFIAKLKLENTPQTTKSGFHKYRSNSIQQTMNKIQLNQTLLLLFTILAFSSVVEQGSVKQGEKEIFVSELLLRSLLFRNKWHHHVLISCSIWFVCIWRSPCAIAPWCHSLIALQVYVKKGDWYRVNSKMPPG